MKKFLVCSIIVSAVAALSYAAGEQEAGAEKVTITAFAAADASTIKHYNEIDAIFNEKFPNIKIEWQPQAAEGIEEKFISLYITGQSPDLFVDDTERLLPLSTATRYSRTCNPGWTRIPSCRTPCRRCCPA